MSVTGSWQYTPLPAPDRPRSIHPFPAPPIAAVSQTAGRQDGELGVIRSSSDPMPGSQGILSSCLNSPEFCFSKKSCLLYPPTHHTSANHDTIARTKSFEVGVGTWHSLSALPGRQRSLSASAA